MTVSVLLMTPFTGAARLDALLGRVADGEIGALHEIYVETKDAIYRFAMRMLGNRTEAEDAMQETFLRVAGAAGSYTPGSNARAWIFGICRNVCRDVCKEPVTADLDDCETLLPTHDFSDVLIESEDVRRALSVLTAEEKEIVFLHLYIDFKLTDVAAYLHKPYSAVRSHYTYAMQKMKRELGASYRKG
ncbi:MAG: sigma-70 family RNA polymerase sigma factor [Ruminococcus sp.]|nr:sigma-70 family RNA polymerase sigma factor [Candidatus Apopatosoma intestinale]